jgi:hypothetical protein
VPVASEVATDTGRGRRFPFPGWRLVLLVTPGNSPDGVTDWR